MFIVVSIYYTLDFGEVKFVLTGTEKFDTLKMCTELNRRYFLCVTVFIAAYNCRIM